MCGIAGLLNWNGYQCRNTETIVNMIDILYHRGPDDSGLIGYSLNERKFIELPTNRPTVLNFSCNGLMGFDRLSIRDLSHKGHQPMLDVSGKVCITFNGEIYNSDKLKKDLIARGHSFRSTTDTEVILELYLEYGFAKTVHMLNGMFAIVITDLRKGVSYLARDRAGIKPFYYYQNAHGVYYASEMKAFLEIPEFEPLLNQSALHEKLLYRGATYASLLDGIEEIKPGTYLVFKPDVGLKTVQFFSINDYKRPKFERGNFLQRKEMLELALQDSINRQLVSDVKVGCQLSGGVDSSLVCWYAKKINPQAMNDTISIIPENPEFSEEKYIDYVNTQTGFCDHKLHLDEKQVFQTIDKTIWHVETMLTQPSALALYQLTKHAKNHVTVLLSGEGADELMGGYSCWYEPMYHLWNRNPLYHDVEKFENAVVRMDIDSDARWLSHAVPSLEVGEVIMHRKDILSRLSGDAMTRMMKYQFQTYLPELLLRQDKMSMANSIENRVPILDNEVIKYAYSLPSEDMVHCTAKRIQKRKLLHGKLELVHEVTCKYILKEICANKFGHEFAYRNKQGFPMPIIDFMCGDAFKERFNDELLPSIRGRGVINADMVNELYLKNKNLTYRESETLWRIITFEIWCQIFLDGKRKNI